jgi:hypothetical protein
MTTSAAPVDIVNLDLPAGLSPDREAWLVDGLVAALPSLRLRQLFELRRDMFTRADLITVAVNQLSGDAVGALSSRWDVTRHGDRFLHVTTQFVGDDYRHGAVFRQSWERHLGAICTGQYGFPAVTALKTYNPMVFCAIRALSRIEGVSFYPQLEGGPGGWPGMYWLADEIAATIAPGHRFDRGAGVISGAGVPADLYPELPRSADPAVNEYFARSTRPGDRVLCLLTVPTRQAVGELLRRFVPAGRTRVPARGQPLVHADRMLGLPTPGDIPATQL